MKNYLQYEPLIQVGIRQIQQEVLTEEEVNLESENILDRIAGFLGKSKASLLVNNFGLEQHIKNSIQEQINTKQEIAKTMICDEWMKMNIDEVKKRWKRFESFINVLDSEGLPVKVLEILDVDTNNVLKYLPEINKESFFHVFGMVVGLVQSGKTNHMMALANKLFDLNADFVVILAGTTNTLRNQTQDRAEQHVTGYNTSKKQFTQLHRYLEKNEADEVISGTAQDLIDFTKGKPIVLQGGELSNEWTHVTRYEPGKKYLFVIKKHPNILETLMNWFKSQEFFHKPSGKCRKTIVVLDDECDYFSLNTKDNGETTETNRWIRKMLDLFNRSIYTGYTATPFANIFISNNPPDRHLVDFDLFPKHFIQCISTPTNYIGFNHFFNTPQSKEGLLPYIEEIEEYDGDESEYFDSKGEMLSMPPSLKRALHQYLFNGAVSKLRGYGAEHHTMLVHTNVRKIPHKSVVSLLNSYLEKLISEVSKGAAVDFWNDVLDIHQQSFIKNNKVNDYQKRHGLQIYDFNYSVDDLKGAVKDYLLNRRSKVIMVNSDSTNVLNYNSYPDGLHAIAVGGTILSRGYTLRGLSVSYFTRQSSQADLMLQCCRWFGYHELYKDLIRLFTTKTALDVMSYASGITLELFDQFHEMSEKGQTPLQFGFAIEEKKGLLPTARNKMLNSVSSRGNINYRSDYDDALFPLDSENLKTRLNRVNNLIKMLGAPQKHQGVYMYPEVDVKTFTNWIEKWPNIGNNRSLPGKQFAARLKRLSEDGKLSSIDVGIVSMKRSSKSKNFKFERNIEVLAAGRKELVYWPESKTFELSQGRAVTVRHYQYGLTEEEIKIAQKRSGTTFQDRITPESKIISNVRWESQSGPRALFLIYVFDKDLINKSLADNYGIVDGIAHSPIGYHLLLPTPKNSSQIRVNEIYQDKYQEIFNVLRNKTAGEDFIDEVGT